jgi:hypothetical protein
MIGAASAGASCAKPNTAYSSAKALRIVAKAFSTAAGVTVSGAVATVSETRCSSVLICFVCRNRISGSSSSSSVSILYVNRTCGCDND